MRKPIRSIGIIGGGTAGYLAALSLRRQFPALQIEVITAPDIPVIGVGESSLFQLVDFLHDDLGIEVPEFYEAVQPTWKLGARFYWGPPERGWFNYTFQRTDHEVAHRNGVDLRTSTLYGTLMEGQRSFLLSRTMAGSEVETVAVKRDTYAYHLDNRPFIRFLRERIPREGISLQDARVVEARRSADGRDVADVRTADGRTFGHDLWVDCSGFRSLLLEKTLGVPWVTFRSSLLADRAVTARTANGGKPFPGTRFHSAPYGWVWNISMRNEDHLGYVYSSAFAGRDHAEEWLVREFGATLDDVEIPFRSGRHEQAWSGNVVGVGNASGFVEPLQSSGLQMTTIAIKRMNTVIASGPDWRAKVADYNHAIAARWDFLRWFIAVHYRLNRREASSFWTACNETLDMGPFAEIIRYFSERGPLSADDSGAGEAFRGIWDSGLFGPHGVDLILLGLGVRPGARAHPPAPARVAGYRRRRALWQSLLPAAIPMEEALRLAGARPDLVWPRTRAS